MPLIDAVTDGLPHQVVGNGVHGEVVLLECVAFCSAVAALLEGAGHVEMVAPAGEFEAGVAKLASLAGQVFQRKVGPLAGEQRDRTGHGGALKMEC